MYNNYPPCLLTIFNHSYTTVCQNVTELARVIVSMKQQEPDLKPADKGRCLQGPKSSDGGIKTHLSQFIIEVLLHMSSKYYFMCHRSTTSLSIEVYVRFKHR